jgi:aspartate kinase
MDSIKAAGEDNCARLVAGYLKSIGRTASYVDPREAGMFLTEEYGNAQVLPEAYPLLARLRQNPGISVSRVFSATANQARSSHFPRAGSDITGSILAAATEAQTYENWTDVDSVYSVNPTLIATRTRSWRSPTTKCASWPTPASPSCTRRPCCRPTARAFPSISATPTTRPPAGP